MTNVSEAQLSQGRLRDLRETVRRTPGDASAWYALGTAALAVGEVGEARFAFTQSVYLAPHEIAQAVKAADLLAGASCFAEAEHILRRALDRMPDHKDAHVRLCRLLIDTDRAGLAARELGSALRNHPHDLEVRMVAASAHERVGALAEAAEHLSAAIAVDTNHPEANRRLGTILSQLGDTRGAVQCWRRIVDRAGGRDMEALTSLGISLSGDGQHDEAVEILTEVARRQSLSAAAQADLGMALTASGRMAEAAAAFTRALAIEPRSAQVHCGLGIAYQQQGKWHEAAQEFRSTEQLAPENPAGPLNLGLALQALGDREGARRALLRAAALAPDDEDIRSALEMIFAPTSAEPSMPSASLVKSPTPPQGFDASITGNLNSFQLFDVLEFLRLQKKSGSLVVSSRHGAGLVRLSSGGVSSAAAPGVKRLGEALIEGGIISQAELQMALAQQREESRDNAESLGSVLVRDGLVNDADLSAAIRQQVLSSLQEMLDWEEGAFSFHPSEEKTPAPVSFDLQDIMLKLMRLTDERNAGRPERLDD